MKLNLLLRYFIAILLTCFAYNSYATETITVSDQGYMFYDTGGPDGNCIVFEDITQTFIPENEGDYISISFMQFDIAGYDRFYVYDGTEVSSETLIGTYSGTITMPKITASNPEGALTIKYNSMTSATGSGWEAMVSVVPSAVEISSDIIGFSSAPQTIQFSGISIGIEDITSWSWDFNGDGSEDATGQNVSHTFTTVGAHTVQLTVSNTSSTFVTALQVGAYTLTNDDVEVTSGSIKSVDYTTALNNIIIPSELDGQTITEIGTYSFDGRGIKSVNLPHTLTTINNSAFKDNDLINLTIPAGVEIIGDYAFQNNNIETLLFDNNEVLLSIGDRAFMDNSISLINIPASVETIGEFAFRSNGTSNLTFENGSQLKSIGENAFKNHSLSSVMLPNSVIAINTNAFYTYYSSFTGFTLPTCTVDGFITWIDGSGTEYNNGDEVTDFETSYSALIPYTLTNDDVVVEDGIIKSCSYNYDLKHIIIPNELDGQVVTEIGSMVFSDKGILSITLPNALETIGYRAFYNNNIGVLNIPASVETIGDYAFYSNNIGVLNIPASVETIGDFAFAYNYSTQIDFEDGSLLREIGENAFYIHNCSSITLPNSVITIGVNALKPTSLNNVFSSFALPTCAADNFITWINGSGTEYANGAIVTEFSTSYEAMSTYTLTNDDVVVEDGIIKSCDASLNKKYIIIPSTLDGQTVNGIAESAFESIGLIYVQIPSTVESIETSAFKDNELSRIIFENESQLQKVGPSAFENHNLTELNLPITVSYIGEKAFSKSEEFSFTLPNYSDSNFLSWFDTQNNIYSNNDLVTDMSLGYFAKHKFLLYDIDGTVSQTIFNNIDVTSATVSSSIVIQDNESFSSSGFCYAQDENPTVEDQVIDLGEFASSGSISTQINNLEAETTYYIRSYCKVDENVYYGEVTSFATGKLICSGGSGTETDPFIIATLDDLRELSENSDLWDQHFIQTANIDATETSTWNDGQGFSPIGNTSIGFSGVYNGSGYTISALSINRPSELRIGLFGLISSESTISNIALTNASIIGWGYVGIIVGMNEATVSNCYSSGSVQGTYAAGVAGVNSGELKNVYTIAQVEGSNIGGAVAMQYGTVSNIFYIEPSNGQTYATEVGTELSASEMMQMSSYTGWDFEHETTNGSDNVWAIACNYNDGYPFFSNASITTYPIYYPQIDHIDNADELYSYYASEGATFTLVEPEPSLGYEFSGWYTDDQYTTTISSEITSGTAGELNFYCKIEEIAQPLVGTCSISKDKFSTDAQLSSQIYLPSGTSATAHGFCYGTSATPGLNDQVVDLGSIDESTTLSTTIQDLLYETSYYVRSYVSVDGTTYWGEVASFTTSEMFCSGGSGTETDPFIIATLDDLRVLSENSELWDQHFIQTANIDASETTTWNDGQGFSPIGNRSPYFSGVYNGGGYTISALSINRTDEEYVGLFGVLDNSTISNIGLVDCRIIGYQYVGTITGYNYYTTISNCYSSGSVEGDYIVGGVCGTFRYGTLSHIYTIAEVEGQGNVGGVIGQKMGGVINAYYIEPSNGQTYDIENGTILSAPEMMQMSSYSGWDFVHETTNGSDDVWAIASNYNDGYPFLSNSSVTTYPIYYSSLDYIANTDELYSYYASEGATFTLVEPEPSLGYQFSGWYSDDQYTKPISSEISTGTTGAIYCKIEEAIQAVAYTCDITLENINDALLSSQIYLPSGTSATAHGFCYGTSENPTINDEVIDLGALSASIEFSATAVDLLYETNYYVSSYVTVDGNTLYGEMNTFFIPVPPASNLTFTNESSSSGTLTWDKGNGSHSAVFVKESTDRDAFAQPNNGTNYQANAKYGLGDEIGASGWYCIYNGTDEEVIVEALESFTSYQIHVVDYVIQNGEPIYCLDEDENSTSLVKIEYNTQAGPTDIDDSNVEQVSLIGENGTAINYTPTGAVLGVDDQTELEACQLYAGEAYSLSVLFGTFGVEYFGFGVIYIDWNGDLDFDDDGERVADSQGTPWTAPWDTPVVFDITVPADVLCGSPIAMRVIQHEDHQKYLLKEDIGPDDVFDWGSVMDFTLSIEQGIIYRNLEGQAAPEPTTYTIDEEITHLLPLEDTQTQLFGGWYTYNGVSVDTVSVPAIPLGSTGTKKFYAKWLDKEADVVCGMTIEHEGMGTTIPALGECVILEGGTQQFQATAQEGFIFDKWVINDVEYSSDNFELTVDSALVATAYFTAIDYTMTVSLAGTGELSVETGDSTVHWGDVIELIATEAEHATFSEWMVDGVSYTSSNISITITGNTTVQAIFEQEQLMFNLSTVGAGNVSPEVGQRTIDWGDTLNFVATADQYWSFDCWKINDEVYNLESVTMVAKEEIEAKAYFIRDKHMLELEIEGEGTVNHDIYKNTYYSGDTLKLMATPEEGWAFEKWLVNDVVYDQQEIEIQILENTSFVAVFVKGWCDVAFSTEGEGSISPNSADTTYSYATELTIEAVESIGWEFDKWMINGNELFESSITITLLENTEIQALFTQLEQTVSLAMAGEGTLNFPVGDSTMYWGTEIELIATPNEGWIFEKWTIDDVENYESNISITIDKDMMVAATFVEFMPQLSINKEGEGSYTPAIVDSSYIYGTEVILSAIPEDGWSFDKWVVDGIEMVEETITVTLNENTKATVYFVENTYQIVYRPNGGDGIMSISDNLKGTVQINACNYNHPDCSFIGWSTTADGEVEYAPGDEFIIVDDMELYAVWKLNTANQAIDDLKISIYPNPAHEWITIEMSNEQSIDQLNIINASGQVVRTLDTSSRSIQNEKIDVSTFSPGIYIITCMNGATTIQTVKFIKK